jgi:Fur family iron response transcriptional regulator
LFLTHRFSSFKASLLLSRNVAKSRAGAYKLDMNIQSEQAAERLRRVGLRPTRQRRALARLLFSGEHRHVSAESLHDEALRAHLPVSLATVYNTLNQFKAAGLLREVAIEGSRSYFDTNTSNHCHYFLEDSGELLDLDASDIAVHGLPQLPAGTTVDRIDVIVRLKKASP